MADYVINTSVAPTEGFTGKNMGYSTFQLQLDPAYLSGSIVIQRFPSGCYFLQASDVSFTSAFLSAPVTSDNWYKLIEFNPIGTGIANFSYDTFYPTFFLGILRKTDSSTEVTIAEVALLRNNYENTMDIEMYSTMTATQISAYKLSFQLMLTKE